MSAATRITPAQLRELRQVADSRGPYSIRDECVRMRLANLGLVMRLDEPPYSWRITDAGRTTLVRDIERKTT